VKAKVNKLKVDKSWSLFLDRDGVINKRLLNDYVKGWQEFEFMPDVLTTISKLSKIFGHIFVFTNQQGIGKGLMLENDLINIHNNMVKEIQVNGGKIDAVYYCPHLKSADCLCRKPSTFLLKKAQAEYQDICFSKAIMVGDMPSDIEFGKNIGAYTIMLSNTASTTADYNIRLFKELLAVIST